MKAKRGSILVWVVILFAVIMITGTTLMAQVTQSHKMSLLQENQQQAYYAAQAVLETCVKAFEKQPDNTSKFIGKGASEPVIYTDNKGGEWKCTVDITRKADLINIKVISKGGGSLGVESTANAQLKEVKTAFGNECIFESTLDEVRLGIGGDPAEIYGIIRAKTSINASNITNTEDNGHIVLEAGTSINASNLSGQGDILLKSGLDRISKDQKAIVVSNVNGQGKILMQSGTSINASHVKSSGDIRLEALTSMQAHNISSKNKDEGRGDIFLEATDSINTTTLVGRNITLKSKEITQWNIDASGKLVITNETTKNELENLEGKDNLMNVRDIDIIRNTPIAQEKKALKIINIPIPEGTGKQDEKIIVKVDKGKTVEVIYHHKAGSEVIMTVWGTKDHLFVLNIPEDRKIDVKIMAVPAFQNDQAMKIHLNNQGGNLSFEGELKNATFEGSFKAKKIEMNSDVHNLKFEYRSPIDDGISGSNINYSLLQYSGG
ncbi:MAG: hypothetical protein ACRCW2_16435 [Cellulosilyticaceae bacterium]